MTYLNARALCATALVSITTLALGACTGMSGGTQPLAQHDQNPAHQMHYSQQTGTTATANPMVGGAEMYASKTIVENAVNSADHTTLVAAVKAAGLVDTLSGQGPFTVFAPTNTAFDALPAGTVDTLLMPANKGQLTRVLTCHVVAGKVSAMQLSDWIGQNGGSYTLNTVGGCPLVATKSGTMIWLKDGMGGMASISTANVMQSNGVIHVVDHVLLPAM